MVLFLHWFPYCQVKTSTFFLLGGLCRCNYCENGPVLDSNQHLLFASLVCYPFTPTGLKLSNLSISYDPFSRSFCTPRFHFSSKVYVEQVELIVSRAYMSRLSAPLSMAMPLIRCGIKSGNRGPVIAAKP